MSASARIRQSLEPLAAAVVAFGLLHLLIGFLILNVLPEVHRKAVDKTSSKLVWKAPTDFLFNKTFHLALPILGAALKTSVMAELPVPSTAPFLTLAAGRAAAAPPTVSKRQELKPQPTSVSATPAPGNPPEKTLAAISRANSGLLSPLASSGSLESMPFTARAESPMFSHRKDLVVQPALPAAPVPQPVGAETSLAPVISALSNSGNRNATHQYITLSAILPPGKAPAKPTANQPVLNLLDIAKLSANERAEAAEAGGADMDAVEKTLQMAILKEWIAPAAHSVPPSQRRATMEVAILRDGTIADASIKTASGSSLLDASIRQAADRLKKIPATLPSNFPKERYELRVNFQIE